MKKFLVMAALAAMFVQVKAQTIEVKQVPGPVITTFQTSNPDVKAIVWKKSGTYYVVDYSQGNSPMYITYDPSGNVIETGEGLVTTNLPSSMTTYVKTKYKDGEIKKVYKIKNAKGDVVYKGKVNDTYLIFDSQGNYLRTEKRMAYGDWDK